MAADSQIVKCNFHGARQVGHSQAEKARSRDRILNAAALQLRELGLAGISIGELMKSAKLTHGGFYGHFESRDDLIAQALDCLPGRGPPVRTLVATHKHKGGPICGPS